jgi:hypothetical protein
LEEGAADYKSNLGVISDIATYVGQRVPPGSDLPTNRADLVELRLKAAKLSEEFRLYVDSHVRLYHAWARLSLEIDNVLGTLYYGRSAIFGIMDWSLTGTILDHD